MRPEGVRTEAPARAIGYEPRIDCKVGERVAVSGRSWLADGKCDCRGEATPVVASDCRIVDGDDDGQPGITVQHAGLLNDPEPVRVVDNTQISHGTLREGGRIDAFFIENYDFLPINCGANACSRNQIAACKLELNPVAFEPLPDGEWTCDRVMEQVEAGKLFARPMLITLDEC